MGASTDISLPDLQIQKNTQPTRDLENDHPPHQRKSVSRNRYCVHAQGAKVEVQGPMHFTCSGGPDTQPHIPH